MPKEHAAADFRKRNSNDLLADLKKLREELQNIRFTKVSGTAVAKLSKIKVRKTYSFPHRHSEKQLQEF